MQQFSGPSSVETVSYYDDCWSFILDSLSRCQWMDGPACFLYRVLTVLRLSPFIVMRCSWSIYRLYRFLPATTSDHFLTPSLLVGCPPEFLLHTVSICSTNASSASLTSGRVHIVKNSYIPLMSNSSCNASFPPTCSLLEFIPLAHPSVYRYVIHTPILVIFLEVLQCTCRGSHISDCLALVCVNYMGAVRHWKPFWLTVSVRFIDKRWYFDPQWTAVQATNNASCVSNRIRQLKELHAC